MEMIDANIFLKIILLWTISNMSYIDDEYSSVWNWKYVQIFRNLILNKYLSFSISSLYKSINGNLAWIFKIEREFFFN